MVDRIRSPRSPGPLARLARAARFARFARFAAAAAATTIVVAVVSGVAWGGCPVGRDRGGRGERLLVGFAPMPPFVVPDGSDGQVGGIAIDVLRAAAAREGWNLDFVELSLETLQRRVSECEVDVGVAGVPVHAALAESVDFSQPYFSTTTTALVRADDLGRAGPGAGDSRSGRVARALLRGLTWGAGALALLALSSWILNATGRRRCGRPGLSWRRADASVSGPLAGLRWLWRSMTGRVLAAVWVAVGLAIGATGRSGGGVRLVIGDDPLRALVDRAAHTESLVGERYPDGALVACAGGSARPCLHSFAEGVLAAVAGPREVLCSEAVDLGLDGVVLRDDLAVPEQYAFLLPPGSGMRQPLDRALLRLHERETVRREPVVRCPGESR